MGALELENYQLESVIKGLCMPRVNLLIVDDVRLDKTIKGGLVVQKLIAINRICRNIIMCPASLMKQWQDEMKENFNLELRIIDRDSILRLLEEYGIRDFYIG